MQGYELIIIIHPSLNDENATAVVAKYQEIITQNEGNVISSELWDRKKLAYSIKKQEFGTYFVIYFEALTKITAELYPKISFDEFVLKSLLFKCDDPALESEFFKKLKADPAVTATLYTEYKKGE